MNAWGIVIQNTYDLIIKNGLPEDYGSNKWKKRYGYSFTLRNHDVLSSYWVDDYSWDVTTLKLANLTLC